MNTSPNSSYKTNASDKKFYENNISASNLNNYCEEVTVDDNIADTEGLNVEDKDNVPKICIPLQSCSDICDTGDVWRAWSCIILAHLLRNTLVALSKKTTNTSSKEGESENIRTYRTRNLKQRGRYLTRRKTGKHSWQKLKILKKAFTED